MLRWFQRLVAVVAALAAVTAGMAAPANAATTLNCNEHGCSYFGPSLMTGYGEMMLWAVQYGAASANPPGSLAVSKYNWTLDRGTSVSWFDGLTQPRLFEFTATAIDGQVGSFEGFGVVHSGYGEITLGTQFRYDSHYGCIGRWGNYNWGTERFYPEGDGGWFVWLCA